MPELLLCCVLLCSHCPLFCALQCCLLLLQLCLLLKHLRSFAFSPFFTGFCHFRIFHTSLSAIFHTSLSPFFLQRVKRFLVLFHFPYLTNLLGEALSILLRVVLLCVFLKFTSIIFVLDFCRNFYSVAHFGEAVIVFSARFGDAF